MIISYQVTWGAGQNGTNATWGVDQLALPTVLPAVPQTTRHRAPTPHTWAFNVVGFSYSSVWWDWARWERELDWMALHGVNLALAFVGQEHLWHRLYAEHLGLSEVDIEAYFAGPAYLSWNRMGNLQLFGGPLPSAWRAQQFALQRRILQVCRMTLYLLTKPPYLSRASHLLIYVDLRTLEWFDLTSFLPSFFPSFLPSLLTCSAWWTSASPPCCRALRGSGCRTQRRPHSQTRAGATCLRIQACLWRTRGTCCCRRLTLCSRRCIMFFSRYHVTEFFTNLMLFLI